MWMTHNSYEAAIRDDPHHAAAHSQLGNMCFGRGDYEAAVRHLERGLKHDSDHFVRNNNAAGAHYRLGNIDKALRYWGKCLEIDPGNEDVIRQISTARGASRSRGDW
jgi:tetratricopeptide (TPR) repeat protein